MEAFTGRPMVERTPTERQASIAERLRSDVLSGVDVPTSALGATRRLLSTADKMDAWAKQNYGPILMKEALSGGDGDSKSEPTEDDDGTIDEAVDEDTVDAKPDDKHSTRTPLYQQPINSNAHSAAIAAGAPAAYFGTGTNGTVMTIARPMLVTLDTTAVRTFL